MDNRTKKVEIAESLRDARSRGDLLPVPNSDWLHPNSLYANAVIFSACNSKVKRGTGQFGYKYSLSYGKPSIMACPFAGKCHEYCYASIVTGMYKNSLRMKGHNYYQVYRNSHSAESILECLENGLKVSKYGYKTDIIRINDDADFMFYNELKAWYLFAINHPEIVMYGYTKSTPYFYRLLKEFGQMPSNFRINISVTDNPESTEYLGRIQSEFPEYAITCTIIESIETDIIEIPFNNEEEYAIKHVQNFKIAIHGTFKANTPEFVANKYFKEFAKEANIKVC